MATARAPCQQGNNWYHLRDGRWKLGEDLHVARVAMPLFCMERCVAPKVGRASATATTASWAAATTLPVRCPIPGIGYLCPSRRFRHPSRSSWMLSGARRRHKGLPLPLCALGRYYPEFGGGGRNKACKRTIVMGPACTLALLHPSAQRVQDSAQRAHPRTVLARPSPKGMRQ